MKRISLIFILLMAVCCSAWCQRNITIRGTIDGGKGKRVELYRYSDKISRHEVLLDTFRLGDDQKFELHMYANYPTLVFIQVERYSQSFYVEPGRTYNTYVDSTFDWNQDEKYNVYLEPAVLELQFLGLPGNDINLLVDSLDRTVARYLQAHRGAFDQRFRPRRHYFDSLMTYVDKHCPDVEDCDFFNRYKRYSLAEMKLNMHLDSRKHIYETYIQGQPILTYDENYMQLFSSLYANAISKGTKKVDVRRIAHWVYNHDLETFADSIGMDPLLRHEQVRELAMIQGLKEAYYNFHYYDADMVVRMLRTIGERTKFPDHKRIANNVIASFKTTDSEEEHKIFRLPDLNKHLITLDTFKGYWTYIAFVRVDDPNSLGEIETMAHFFDTVYRSSDSIEFLTIVCDREFQKMYHFLRNSKNDDKYDWSWLHFDGNYDFLAQYGVCSFPWFALLDPQGRLHYDVTPAPSTGILLSPPWTTKEPAAPRRSLLFQHIQMQQQKQKEKQQ